MANKRIELEQYRHYVNLLVEEPNRKTWRRGIEIVMVTALLLVLAMFVLGMMSGSLASNPRNVLEKPPEKQEPAPTDGQQPPGGFQMDQVPRGGDQLPEGLQLDQLPQEGQQPPEGFTPVPDQGNAPSPPVSLTLPYGASGGALLAQAQPEPFEEAPPGTPQEPTIQEGEPPPAGIEAPPAEGGEQAQERKGPGEQTTGVGNLSNLANGAGGRGLQLYLLALFIGLCVLLYLPIRKARLEGKSR